MPSRRILLLPAAAFLLSTSARSEQPDAWTPSLDQVQQVENIFMRLQSEGTIHLPSPVNISTFVRYYAGTSVNGRKFIKADLVSGAFEKKAPQILIGDAVKAPLILDGGCGVVHFTFDVSSRKFEGLLCNGIA